MRRSLFGAGAIAASAAVAAGTLSAAPAHAADTVTYEIVSSTIPVVDVDYMGPKGRTWIPSIHLPWRMDVSLGDAEGPTGIGAQLRADWRWSRGAAKWVTLRIYANGELLCQTTLDVGNASCYGNTPHFS